jgi:Ran GTPase-activating protein (RanGAP) involved in mRNA processing and transport
MEHLLENNTLKVLDLNANEVSFRGCEAIAKYLKSENCSLESLHLSGNCCSDYGSKAMAQDSFFQNTQTTYSSKTIILCNWLILLILIATASAGDLMRA